MNKGGVAHAQGDEDIVGHVLLERLSRGALNDVARHGGRVIRVGGRHAWRKNSSRRMLAQILAERPHFGSVLDEQFLDGLLETRCVGQNIAQGNGLSESRRNLVVQIIIYVAVEIELALLNKLHHRSPGE